MLTRLLATQIASMTELRDPQKVLDAANGQPVRLVVEFAAVVGSARVMTGPATT